MSTTCWTSNSHPSCFTKWRPRSTKTRDRREVRDGAIPHADIHAHAHSFTCQYTPTTHSHTHMHAHIYALSVCTEYAKMRAEQEYPDVDHLALELEKYGQKLPDGMCG